MLIPHYLVGSVSQYSGQVLDNKTTQEAVPVVVAGYEEKVRASFESFANYLDSHSYTHIGAVFHNMAINWRI